MWEFPLGDAGVVVRADSLDLYALNPTAYYAWSLLKSRKSLEEASSDFSAKFGVSQDVARQDIRSAWDLWARTLLSDFNPEESPLPVHPLGASDFSFVADYQFCNRVIRVASDDCDLADEIGWRLEPVRINDRVGAPDVTFQLVRSEANYHVYRDFVWLFSEPDLSEARILFLREFVRYAIPHPKWIASFHAAACGRQDRCVLFPAESQSGKTTLAAALMHAGLLLYTEDTAVLQAGALTVSMTPFSLMIREGSISVLAPRFPELLELPAISRNGATVRFLAPSWNGEAASATVSAIVFGRYQSASSTEIYALDSFEALIRLQESGFWVEHDRQSIAEFIDWLGSRPSYSMVYSDVDEAVAFVRQLLDAP